MPGPGPRGPAPFGPMMPMPPMMPPFGPPPRRSGFLKGVLSVLVVLFFLGAGCFALLVWAAQSLSGLGSAKGVSQTIITAGDAKEQIGVIDVSGMILNSSAERFDRLISAAAHDSTIKALIIRVETPGGLVTASDQIYHSITKFREAHPRIPVVISMGGMATSGGYYISCAGDHIVAQPTTLTADIGVLMEGVNVSQLTDKWGIKDTTLSAPSGGYKAAGWPLAPVNPRDTAYIQGLVDEMFRQFKSVVVSSRDKKLVKKIDEIADGRAIFGADAMKLGLVDEIGYFDDACFYATSVAKLSNNRQVVRLHEPSPSLLERLFISDGGEDARFAGEMPRAGTTVNGVNINVDATAGRDWAGPQLLYLYRGN